MQALLHAPFGGAEFGECMVTASRITAGDREGWKREWVRLADQVLDWAEASASGQSVDQRARRVPVPITGSAGSRP